ncbi:hypothetical protein HK405_012198 [Cladochytrium tenue]|nr:hypothetical protein HK405_012198 [Cladochytrium tenue]
MQPHWRPARPHTGSATRRTPPPPSSAPPHPARLSASPPLSLLPAPPEPAVLSHRLPRALPSAVDAGARYNKVVDLEFWWRYSLLAAARPNIADGLRVALLVRRACLPDGDNSEDQPLVVDLGPRPRRDGRPGVEIVYRAMSGSEAAELVVDEQGAIPYEYALVSDAEDDPDVDAFADVFSDPALGDFLRAFYELTG